MKHVFRFMIILGISFMGELLARWIPAPIPGSIYGLVLMFLGLLSGIIPLESVLSSGRFLVEIMPIMFIPTLVGLMDTWPVLRPMLVPVLLISFISTFVVMGCTGLVTQILMHRKSGERRK